MKAEPDKLDIDELKTFSDDLSNLKSKVNKLDNGKLATVPADLSKLSNIVNNDVVRKVAYKAKVKIIEDKIPYITN